jgi:hypothetical protein
LREAKNIHSTLPGDGTSRRLNASHTNTLVHGSPASNTCNEADFKFQMKKEKAAGTSELAATVMLLSLDDNY